MFKNNKNIDQHNMSRHENHIRIKISMKLYINNQYTFDKKIHVSTALGDTIVLTSV